MLTEIGILNSTSAEEPHVNRHPVTSADLYYIRDIWKITSQIILKHIRLRIIDFLQTLLGLG